MANEACEASIPVTVDDNNNGLFQDSIVWKDHSYTTLHKEDVEMRNAEVQTDLTVQDISIMECDQGLVTPLVERLTKSDESVKKNFGVPTINMLFGLFAILDAACANIKYWSRKESVDDKMYEDGHQNKPGPARKVVRFHEYLMTLLRIRQVVSTSLLADLFGISESRVSQIFSTWTNVMYRVFHPQIKWPSRQQVKKFMPHSFKAKFPDTRVIIDCTEIFIQRPRTPTAQNQTYSNYKSHNTFKCLVGITPSGAFSFLSELWGGNVSDRYITANSGFLDCISPGDVVMVDRGFMIRDYLLERKAKLIIPPFTQKYKWGKGKRLTTKQVRETRDIARLRLHVERAIQRLKCFRLLSNVMPLSLKPLASQILAIAAFLCNLGQPLVK